MVIIVIVVIMVLMVLINQGLGIRVRCGRQVSCLTSTVGGEVLSAKQQCNPAIHVDYRDSNGNPRQGTPRI